MELATIKLHNSLLMADGIIIRLFKPINNVDATFLLILWKFSMRCQSDDSASAYNGLGANLSLG